MRNITTGNQHKLFRPDSNKIGSTSATRVPLVVITSSTGSLESARIISPASFLTNGAPPVRRFFLRPYR
nr:hypothetical protein [Pedobacter nototheniae]